MILKNEIARTSAKRKGHEKGNGTAQSGRDVGRKSARREMGLLVSVARMSTPLIGRPSDESMDLVLWAFEGVSGCVTSDCTDHAPYCKHGEGLGF